jgi:hypothetical protein
LVTIGLFLPCSGPKKRTKTQTGAVFRLSFFGKSTLIHSAPVGRAQNTVRRNLGESRASFSRPNTRRQPAGDELLSADDPAWINAHGVLTPRLIGLRRVALWISPSQERSAGSVTAA